MDGLLILIFCNSLVVLTNGQNVNTLNSITTFETDTNTRAFVCTSPLAVSSVQWIVNGSSLEDLNLGNTTRTAPIDVMGFGTIGGTLMFPTVPVEYNGTTVQCEITFVDDTIRQSNVATLLVQGLLEAVSDVSVEFGTTFTISWRAPLTLVVPDAPNISYCISITNSLIGSALGNECGVIATRYSVHLELSACVEYAVIITPSNPVGNGTSATKIFPEAPGVVSADNVTRVVQPDGVLVYEILLLDQVCTCEVVLAEANISCVVTNGSSVIFRIAGDPFFNQFLIITVTLRLARLNTSSSVNISTHDVDTIAINATTNAVGLSASYIENSPALGVLFILLLSSGAGGVDYTQSVFLVLDRVMANGFVQGNITGGQYTVLAFDVEDDGGVALGQSSPAAVESVTVQGQDLPAPFSYPPVDGLQCSMDIENDNLVVSCNYNQTLFMGYVVILQSAGSFDVVVKESRNFSSPVEFVGLSSGLHSVTVFPLTGSGIVDTTVAHSQQINVEPLTTTSTTSTISSELSASDSTTITTLVPVTPRGSDSQTSIIIAVVVVVAITCLAILGITIIIFIICKYRSRHPTNSEPLPDSPNSLEGGEYKKKDKVLASKKQPHTKSGPQAKAIEPLYAEAIAVTGGSGKMPPDETTVLYSSVHRTLNAENLQYEMVQLKTPKQPTVPEDMNKVEYAQLDICKAQPTKPPESSSVKPPKSSSVKPPESETPDSTNPPESSLPMPPESSPTQLSASVPDKPSSVSEPPETEATLLTGAEMMALLLPIANMWKKLGGKLGCGEDHIDEIFTNNETDQECLRNLVDIYNLRMTTASLAVTLMEMGETELAGKCSAGKHVEWLLPGQPTT